MLSSRRFGPEKRADEFGVDLGGSLGAHGHGVMVAVGKALFAVKVGV